MTLTAKKVDQLRQRPGRYLDGGDLGRGLYLQVGKYDVQTKRWIKGGASWLLRYEIASPTTNSGRRDRWLGLGGLADFSLKEARERARKARQLLADGIDPLVQKKATKATKALQDAKAISFEEAARQFFDAHKKKWSVKHADQFLSSLTEYGFPIIGKLAVADVNKGEVLRVLEQKHAE